MAKLKKPKPDLLVIGWIAWPMLIPIVLAMLVGMVLHDHLLARR